MSLGLDDACEHEACDTVGDHRTKDEHEMDRLEPCGTPLSALLANGALDGHHPHEEADGHPVRVAHMLGDASLACFPRVRCGTEIMSDGPRVREPHEGHEAEEGAAAGHLCRAELQPVEDHRLGRKQDRHEASCERVQLDPVDQLRDWAITHERCKIEIYQSHETLLN